METLNLAPDQENYSLSTTDGIIRAIAEGAQGRYRRSVYNDARLATFQWFLDETDFQTLKTFYDTNDAAGFPRFLLELFVDSDELLAHQCCFVPGSFSFSVQGLSFTVTAQCEVEPLPIDLQLELPDWTDCDRLTEWEPVLRDGLFRYSLVDDFSMALVEFDETTVAEAQGTFGDVNSHPVNGPEWPVNTITPAPNTGDVIWVRKTTILPDFISTWTINVVHDNTVRMWFNGTEVFASIADEFSSSLTVTPVLGENVFVIRVRESLGAAPTNHSQAGFEITRA